MPSEILKMEQDVLQADVRIGSHVPQKGCHVVARSVQGCSHNALCLDILLPQLCKALDKFNVTNVNSLV